MQITHDANRHTAGCYWYTGKKKRKGEGGRKKGQVATNMARTTARWTFCYFMGGFYENLIRPKKHLYLSTCFMFHENQPTTFLAISNNDFHWVIQQIDYDYDYDCLHFLIPLSDPKVCVMMNVNTTSTSNITSSSCKNWHIHLKHLFIYRYETPFSAVHSLTRRSSQRAQNS